MREKDIFQIRGCALKTVAWVCLAIDPDHRATGHQFGREDRLLPFSSRELLFGHRLVPDFARDLTLGLRRGAAVEHPPVIDDCHMSTQLFDILHNVRRQDHDDALAHFCQQIVEPVPFPRIQSGGRFVDDQQLGITQQRRTALRRFHRTAAPGRFQTVAAFPPSRCSPPYVARLSN